MIKYTLLVISLLCGSLYTSLAQTISIKQFGAKGNGRSNDQDAFMKAADFINKKKKNVNLIIPAGQYLVGKQVRGYGNNFTGGYNVMELQECSKIKITMQKGASFRYADSLLFGSFDPNNGKLYEPKLPFTNKAYAAQIGGLIFLDGCRDIQISGITANGNADRFILGGRWGDVGYQLAHYGILLFNCTNITITNCYLHHFALDGISIKNDLPRACAIRLKNCKMEYNARCALSWVGGQGVSADACSFSFSGKGKISSSPGAGIDIECENNNAIRDGYFSNCVFENNSGCGLIADTGPSSNNTFENCTFWGVTNWSVWIQKPAFQFNSCNFYGSFVHGFITTKPEEATRFKDCNFEDKLYHGQELFGGYLLESDGRKLMYFDHCTFTANKKKIMWYNGSGQDASQMALFSNCTFNVKTTSLSTGDFYAVIRKAKLDGLNLNLYASPAKKYYLADDGTVITNLNRKEWSK